MSDHFDRTKRPTDAQTDTWEDRSDWDRNDVQRTEEERRDRDEAAGGERPGVGERAPIEDPDAEEGPPPTLISLSENPITLENPSSDVRGFEVYDRDGDDIGKVDDLLVDDGERRVRFLNVKSGGFLGFGGDTRLIPVDAITRVDEGEVHLDQSRDHVGGGPTFDPNVNLDAHETYEGVYGHYGYLPFWRPGYVYPPDPFVRRR